MNKYAFHFLALKQIKLLVVCVVLMSINTSELYAQNTIALDTAIVVPLKSEPTRTFLGGTFTNSGFGGPAVKFSRFNNQLAIMTGGRGAATINNKYTIGGGGYGIASAITLPSENADTTRYFKMGYGGLELGYVFLSSGKLSFGTNVLLAAGAAFTPSKPQSALETSFGDEFKFLSVIEPSIYAELALNRFMKLHAGVSYRYVNGQDLMRMKVRDMNRFSCYLALLFGK